MEVSENLRSGGAEHDKKKGQTSGQESSAGALQEIDSEGQAQSALE